MVYTLFAVLKCHIHNSRLQSQQLLCCSHADHWEISQILKVHSPHPSTMKSPWAVRGNREGCRRLTYLSLCRHTPLPTSHPFQLLLSPLFIIYKIYYSLCEAVILYSIIMILQRLHFKVISCTSLPKFLGVT